MKRRQPEVRAAQPPGRAGDPRARSEGDFTETQRLLRVLQRPFDEQPEHEAEPAFRPTGRNDPRSVLLIMSKHAMNHDTTIRATRCSKTDAEWRAQLDPMQYQVARHAATERAFTGKYWDHCRDGSYHCVGCGTPLFSPTAKFDAGCGWPSYAEPINSDVIERVRDTATAWCASKCAAPTAARHLGHVFDDGPAAERRALLHQLGRDRLRPAQMTGASTPVPGAPATLHRRRA